MNELDYWAEAIDEFAIFVAIFFEHFHALFKELKDGTWSVTALDFVSERVIFQVDPRLLGVVVQCIENQLKVGTGHRCKNQRIGDISLAEVTADDNVRSDFYGAQPLPNCEG